MMSEIINPSRAGMPSYARASVDETRRTAARAAFDGDIARSPGLAMVKVRLH
jgi:hypothetical protein